MSTLPRTLSQAQLFALAWAARPDGSMPPLEVFGVEARGKLGRWQPDLSRRTWRVLEVNGLIEVGTYDSGHVRSRTASKKGRQWLQERDLLEAALRPRHDRPDEDRLPV